MDSIYSRMKIHRSFKSNLEHNEIRDWYITKLFYKPLAYQCNMASKTYLVTIISIITIKAEVCEIYKPERVNNFYVYM